MVVTLMILTWVTWVACIVYIVNEFIVYTVDEFYDEKEKD